MSQHGYLHDHLWCHDGLVLLIPLQLPVMVVGIAIKKEVTVYKS